MRRALEDSWWDVLGKAQRGLGWSMLELEGEVGQALCEGEGTGVALQRAAEVLGLSGVALRELAEGPQQVEESWPEGVWGFRTPFVDEWEVNHWAAFDEERGEALLFDTGTVASETLGWLRERNLKLVGIFLTHTHWDHVEELPAYQRAWPEVPVWVSAREPLVGRGVRTFEAGSVLEVGRWVVETRGTWGHTVGGSTFVLSDRKGGRVAVVGDALFARSMGKANVSYEACLRTGGREILALPPETWIAPGHGPSTTVGEERLKNPFFGPGSRGEREWREVGRRR